MKARWYAVIGCVVSGIGLLVYLSAAVRTCDRAAADGGASCQWELGGTGPALFASYVAVLGTAATSGARAFARTRS